MGGHATHDETEAREMFPATVFEYWGKRDPIGVYESYLERVGISKVALEQAEQRVLDEIARAEKDALNSRDTSMPKREMLTQGVYAGLDTAEISPRANAVPPQFM